MNAPPPIKKRKIRRLTQSDVTTHEDTDNFDDTEITYNNSIDSSIANQRNDATVGTIKRIILKNFLCHEFLDFDDFSPNINFLQGKNGSGKSAIVIALIVGLGGSSKSTDRGKSFKGLIRNGKNTATIIIYLRNDGPLSYKSDVFGPTIIIERKINLSGANTFKIKSSNGTQLSTKKEFLTKILNWFNIQVDNPITILSQERAKSFLNTTDPKDLFNFYMESTFLRQLNDDILSIKNNLDLTENFIKRNCKAIPGIKKDVKIWRTKADTLMLLTNKVATIKALKNEIIWAEVRDIEDQQDKVHRMKEKSESDSALCEKQLTSCKNKEKNLIEEKRTNDQKVSELVEVVKINEIEQKKNNEEWQKVKMQVRFEINKTKTHQRELTDKQRDIEDLKTRLDKDYDEAKIIWNENNLRIADDRSQTIEEIQSTKDYMDARQVEITHLNQTIEKTNEDLKSSVLEQKAIKSRSNDLHKQLNQLQNVKDSLAVFGQYIPRIVEEINIGYAQGAFTVKPIGPLGRHLKVKDPKWAHIAEQVLSNCITSFLVSNNRDYHVMKKLFSRIIPGNEFKPNIIVCTFRNQIHDYEKFITGTNEYQSLFAILEIDNMHVANTILDQTSCEGTILIPTSDEAIYLLSDQLRVPVNCKMARTLNGDTIYPDPNYRIFSGNRDTRVKYLQVSVQDKIRDLKENMVSTDREVDNFNTIIREKTAIVSQLVTERKRVSKTFNEYQSSLKKSYNHLQELKNQELPPPPDVFQLQQDLKELEEQKSEIHEKITSIELNLKDIDENKKQKEENIKVSNQKGQELQQKINEIEVEAHETLESLKQMKKRKLALTEKSKEIENNLSKNDREFKKVEEIRTAKLAIATEICPQRIVTKKLVHELERNINALTAAVRTVESEHGDSLSVVLTLKKKEGKLKTLQTEIDTHEKFLVTLKRSYEERITLYGSNKKLLRAAISSEFAIKINNRGFEGSIEIDYSKQTLKILVRKLKLKQNDPYQSIKMMSGGERSFATVSFLVSLWGVTGSPLTVMDEFDIFMDCVSKTQCIDIVLNAAVKNNQYILISPQDYQLDSKMRVFRMPDPIRNVTQPLPMQVDEEEEDDDDN